MRAERKNNMSTDMMVRGRSCRSTFIYSAPIEQVCNKCKGTCWKGNDNNFETQAAAREMFGFTPYKCVNDCNGRPRCPYAYENKSRNHSSSVTISIK